MPRKSTHVVSEKHRELGLRGIAGRQRDAKGRLLPREPAPPPGPDPTAPPPAEPTVPPDFRSARRLWGRMRRANR